MFFDKQKVKHMIETLVKKAQQSTYEEAAAIIQAGGLVAFPTETVYGLGANALDKNAVESIFIAKGRPQDNPLIVHIYDKSQINSIAREVSQQAQALIDAFMPGAITIVLKKSDTIPYCVTAGLDSVGIRMPDKAEAREFLKYCGVPVAAPSANISTKISPTSADFVYRDMKGRIPLIIDGGSCEVGIESTVVDMTADKPVILRPGAITLDMIKDVLDSIESFKGKDVSKLPSPGMKYRHYAPQCETVIADTLDSALSYYDKAVKDGKNPVILCKTQNIALLENRNSINLGCNGTEVCKNIYQSLREGEEGFDLIICENLGQEGVYASVMNRIIKAAGGNFV